MFAPYCPTCLTRRLLGPGRIVASAWEQGGAIFLRCHCGTTIAADAVKPVGSARHGPLPSERHGPTAA